MRLVKILATAIWALGVALASAAYADPPATVGRLNYMTGPVSFAPGEAPDDWVAAELNRPITAGDRLWTDNNGFAEMRVGSLGVRMAPQTSMDVLSLDDRTFQLRVAQGNVHLRVRRLPGDRLIEVATPTGSVVIRQPGSYRINVDSSGDFAIVAVRAGGQAEVFMADASVLVRDNEEAEMSGSSRPQLYAAAQLDEFDRWATDRDRRYETVSSTRYVSAEMTGYEDLDHYGQWRTVGEYGNVWVPNSVPTDWAPYRQGHWVWISPWGWTWVDEQPWGFAPFHYGRWVHVNNYWAWAPGRLVERPVYSPALVAFIGGANFSVAVGAGPAVGWIPLGYREPYTPWYTASRTYVQNLNVAHVTNVTNVTNIRYVNRTVPNAVTFVPRETFIAARPVQRDMVRVDSRRIAAAQVTREAPVTQPARTSFARSESGARPPAQVIAREAVTVHKPTAPSRQIVARDARDDQRAAKDGRSVKDGRSTPQVAATAAQLPPVRVIERRQRVSVPVEQAPRAEARAGRQVTQAPRTEAPAAQKGQPQVVQERQRDLQTRQGEQAREQQGERLREQKKQETDQQKAQAVQQAEQLEREKKQRAGQVEQRAQQPERDQGQKAAQDQRNREEQQRAQQERERGQKAAQDQQRQREDQQRAQQERERGQKGAQDQQRQREEQQRAQQERERGQKAAQEQQGAQQERERGQKAAQEQQRAQERERGQKAAQEQGQRQAEQQKAQQERERQQGAALEQQRAREQQAQQQRAQQEQQRAAQQAQKAQQDQQRAAQQAQKAQQDQQRGQQEQQRAQQEQQRGAQQAQKAQQDQQRGQQEQQRQQQAAQQQQKAAQEQQRQQQAAQQAAQQQQKAAQEQQRAQQAAQQQARAQQEQQRQQKAAPPAAPAQQPQEAEKAKRERGRKDADKDKD